jgi:LuxR family maltose regulon positive regulatory protein
MHLLALVHQVRGHDEKADRVLDLLRELDLDHQGREDVATRAMRAKLQLLQGDLAAAARWADAYTAPVPDQPIRWPATPYIIKARIMLARQSEADLATACGMLSDLHAIAMRTHNVRAEIEVLPMLALATNLQGHYDQAQMLLRRAVNLSQPGGFVRVFVDLGPQMKAMLVRLAQHGMAVQTIIATFPHTAPVPPISELLPNLVDALTAREVDILALLREPLSPKEIARQLDIAPATVKRHTINIYSKLGVSNRWDAVTRAEELGQLRHG